MIMGRYAWFIPLLLLSMSTIILFISTKFLQLSDHDIVLSIDNNSYLSSDIRMTYDNHTEGKANKISLGITKLAESATRFCSQKERLEHMNKVCLKHPEARAGDLMQASWRSLVDSKHKIMYCWISKAGCTAMKALLLEAAGLNVTEEKDGHSLAPVHIESVLEQYGLRFFNKLPENRTAEVLSSYFTFMLIRHPFQKLISTYRGKVLDRSTDIDWIAPNALELAYPELFESNKTLAEMKTPQDVLGLPTFDQVLDWIRSSGMDNDHWASIQQSCHPCAHNWSAVLRIETMEKDSPLILDLLKPDVNISDIPVRHSHQDKEIHDQFIMRLPEYDDVKQVNIDYFLEVFQLDMEMFGYGWNRTTNTAYCRIITENGACC